MNKLWKAPLWREADLGKPIPDSPHAVSVALPRWEHVVRYEENDPILLEALSCGYPRFVFNPIVNDLFYRCRERFANPNELCIALPSERVATRCRQFMAETQGVQARIEPYGLNHVFVAIFPAEAVGLAKKFWQHYGDIVSSRLALATLEERADRGEGREAKQTVRERIATLTGEVADNVFLYPSGMAALNGALITARERRPGARTIQLGFPYVDLLHIQTKWGPSREFFPDFGAKSHESVEWLLANESFGALFCEHAANPLLQCAELPRLSRALRERGVPLVVDETVASYINADLLPYADVIITSLTKYFSGSIDVMGGALILNSNSPFYNELKTAHAVEYEDRLWWEDAVTLESNSRDFPDRMRQINANAEALCDHLRKHPKVQRIYYPKYDTPENYAAVMRDGAGYGGLFSLLLHDAPNTAPRFYDALRVSKGPSLGTVFTLACPYTLLAHYQELEWVESVGVSPYLVRVSVGLEPIEDLIHRFEAALSA
ncbi:MAG: hypothetical protein AMXMBFR84_00470 [Candidatus Hydrogenedentota bacterium]